MHRFIKKIHWENGKKEECLRCPRHSQWYRRGGEKWGDSYESSGRLLIED
jgi:hypothetical protein